MREILRRELTLYRSLLETAPELMDTLVAPEYDMYMLSKRQQTIARILHKNSE